MTRTNLIFTHGAVFAVGIAAALIARNASDPQSAAGAMADGPAARHRMGEPAGADGGSAASSRTKPGETRARAGKEAAPLAERLGKLVRIADPYERQRSLMDMIETLGPDEFEKFAEQYRGLDHLADSRGEFELILRGWAKVDPLGALEFAGKTGGPFNTGTILSTWAGNDPAAAERWALAHHEGDGPNPYLPAVIRGLAANDVGEASRLAQTLPLSRERADAVDSITRALFLQSPEAAMAFPAGIADDALRGGFVAAIAGRLLQKDVDQAAAWVGGMPEGEVQSRAARQVAEALVRKDTGEATAWVAKLKPEARAEAARGVIPVMSGADIPGTARWVSGLVGTPGYDSVVEEFVWSCNTRAPEQSAAWIQGVTDPDQQRRLYHRMLGEWAQKDGAAVKQWVASNSVPEDVKRRFLR